VRPVRWVLRPEQGLVPTLVLEQALAPWAPPVVLQRASAPLEHWQAA
jgi:hypothetical protein